MIPKLLAGLTMASAGVAKRSPHRTSTASSPANTDSQADVSSPQRSTRKSFSIVIRYWSAQPLLRSAAVPGSVAPGAASCNALLGGVLRHEHLPSYVNLELLGEFGRYFLFIDVAYIRAGRKHEIVRNGDADVIPGSG